MLKAVLFSAAFVGAGVIGVAAQSTSPSSSGTPHISAATHCKDKATGQVQLDGAADPGSETSGNGGDPMSGMERTKGLGNKGSIGMSGMEDTTGSLKSTSEFANGLQDCPKG